MTRVHSATGEGARTIRTGSFEGPRQWTVAAIARLLQLSEIPVRKAIASGDLHAVRRRQLIRVPDPALRAFLTARRSVGARDADRLGDLCAQRYLTARQAGETVRCSEQTIYPLVASGELAAVRIGDDLRIPRRGLALALEAGLTCPADRAGFGDLTALAYLTTAEVGALLKISGVYKLAGSGQLPAVRIGGRVRVPRQGLQLMLEAGLSCPADRAGLEDLTAETYLTVEEACQLLGMPGASVYHLVESEELAGVWIGSRLRIPSRELRRYQQSACGNRCSDQAPRPEKRDGRGGDHD